MGIDDFFLFFQILREIIFFRYASVMMNLVNDQFGYLIACIERPEDPPGAMPNSLSFPNVKDLFGKHFAVNLMESTVNEKGVKDHTFLLLSDKVTQCGNFKIFLSLRFYVKSILENLEVDKLLFFAILEALNFANLVFFSLQKVQNSLELIFRASKCVKMADFDTLDEPTLISRKICVMEKF